MELKFRQSQSYNKPQRVEKTKHGYYIRQNYSQEEKDGNILYTYDECFLTDEEYNLYTISIVANQEDTSDAFLHYKQKLETPIEYTNGLHYKAKWVKDAKGNDAVYLDYYQKGKIMPSLIYPLYLYDSTDLEENARSFTAEEFENLLQFLALKQEQFYREYKQEKANGNSSNTIA